MTSEREKPFSVVEFDDGICMVPSSWLFKNNTLMCYYPPYQTQIKINKAIALKCAPDCETWHKYTVQKIFCSAENYERGMEKLKLAEAMSDVETSDSGYDKKTRHIRHTKNNSIDSPNSSNDDESDDPNIPKKQPTLPVPPKKPLSTVIYSSIQLPEINNQPMSLPSTPQSSKQSNDASSVYSLDVVESRSDLKSSAIHDVDVEMEFKKIILKKVNYLISKINDIDTKLTLTNERVATPEDKNNNVESLYELFPLKTFEELTKFEEKLEKEDGYFKKMVNLFKGIGGTSTQNVTINIMKRLISNVLQSEYSLHGKKKKRIFKDLHSYKLVLTTVRSHISSATEDEISKIIAVFLTQSSLRFSREMPRKEK